MEPFYFHHPTSISISGPSNSGKTSLVVDIINQKNELFNPVPLDIYFFILKHNHYTKNLNIKIY